MRIILLFLLPVSVLAPRGGADILKEYNDLLLMSGKECENTCKLKHGFYKDGEGILKLAGVTEKSWFGKCKCAIPADLKTFIGNQISQMAARNYVCTYKRKDLASAREALRSAAETLEKSTIEFVSYLDLQKKAADLGAKEREREVTVTRETVTYERKQSENRKVSELNGRLEASQQQVTVLTNQLSASKDESANLTNQLSESKEQVKQLSTDLSAARSEVTKLSRQLTEAERDAERRQGEFSSEVDKLNEQLQQRKQEVKTLKNQLSDERSNSVALSNQLTQLRAKILELTQKLNNSEKSIAEMHKQLHDSRVTIAELNVAVEKSRKECEVLKSEVSQLRNECAGLRSQLKATLEEISKLNEQKIQLQKEATELGEDLRKKSAAFERKDKSAVEELQKVRALYRERNAEVRTINARVADLQSEVNSLQVQLKDAKQELFDTAMQLKRTKQELDRTGEDLTACRDLNGQLCDQLENARKTLRGPYRYKGCGQIVLSRHPDVFEVIDEVQSSGGFTSAVLHRYGADGRPIPGETWTLPMTPSEAATIDGVLKEIRRRGSGLSRRSSRRGFGL